MQAKKPTDQELVKIAFEALDKLKKIQEDPQWQPFSDNPCQMFKMQTENRIMSKGQTKVKIPLKELYNKLNEETSLKKINPQLKEIEVLHKCAPQNGKQARVNYMRYAGIWPVQDRDLVNVAAKEEGDDVCFIATQACDWPKELVKKVTRATCFIGGWILRKVDETTTLVIYISDVDLAGSIPGMIKNQLSQKQASLPSRVEAALK